MALEGVQSGVTSNVIAPNIVASLCSEQADYVTGQVIGVTAASTCSVSEAALANGIAARFRRFQ